jgi:S-layer protein
MSVGTAQVVTLLENVLFESATLAKANAATWVAQSQSIASEGDVAGLAAAMAASPESSIAQQVVRYYEGALGRAPSGFEISYYVAAVEVGLSAAEIAQGASAVPQASWNIIASDFANSPEFSFISAGPGIVPLLYLNILGREPSAFEVAYYQAQIAAGADETVLIQEFTNSPEFQADVGANITSALASYGAAVATGTTPALLPVTTVAETTTVVLGKADLDETTSATTKSLVVNGTAATAGQSAVTAVTGVIGVTGVAAATGVQGVTAVTAVAPVAGQSAVAAASDGAVTVTDAAFASGGAGTLTSVTLNNSGAGSVINDNALAVLTLTGTVGTLTINNNNSASDLALALTVNGLSAADNTVSDANNEIVTLNISAVTADSTLTAFNDSNLANINLSGTNKLTLLAINGSLTSLTVTGAASFSDGATVHGKGLAALGSALTIVDTSSGTFTAALDDTSQAFTAAGSGADIITVSALADASVILTAGTSTANKIIFEGGAYALTKNSSGDFVNFQIVGVAANVTGTVDLSIIDPTATGVEVMGANTITFTKAATNAGITLDASAGATVTMDYADSTGAKDSVTLTMSSAVAALTLQDSAGAGIGTLSIVNSLAAGETNVSPAHVMTTLSDNGLSTLNLSGNAGLTIGTLSETATTATSLTINNSSTDGYGLSITNLTDNALATLTFGGSGVSFIGTLSDSGTTLAISNGGKALDDVDTLAAKLTSLTLGAGVALGQTATASTLNGLQDAATTGVTVAGGSDNAHVTINLTAGAAAGSTDAITLGDGNNIVVDASAAGTVDISLGTGANLVELGTNSLNTTALYNVTLATRTAVPPNAIIVGSAGTAYATAPDIVITGASKGDIIAFANDINSSAAAVTATSLTGASSVSGAVAALEGLLTSAHAVAYGVYGGNTYIVETATGILGTSDTSVIEVTGTQTLTASTGYVTLGSTASTFSGGSLSGSGFTIPAGTATDLTLAAAANVVTLVGPSAGVTDTFTSIAATTGLTINYQATSGTDTILMGGSGGSSASDITSLLVNDTSSGSAGLIIGPFSDNNLVSATYNDSAAAGAVVTQSALVSSSLSTISLTGGVAGQTTNTYFMSDTLTTQGAVTINDSNIGNGATTMGLTLNGGTSALSLNMTGPGTLATGALTDNNLATLALTGSGTGNINVGALSDTMTGAFTVNDTSSSTGADVIVLTGLSAASSLTINDGSAGSLTDNTSYTDSSLATLTLNNTGNAALTIGNAGIQANALTTITITGSGTGSITTGTLSDTGSAALTVTDSYASTGAISLPLAGVSAASSIAIADSAAGALAVGAIADNGMTTLSLTNTGTAALTVGTVTANLMTSLVIADGAGATIGVGAISDSVADDVTLTDSSASTASIGLAVASLPAATSLTIEDSAKGALTVDFTGASLSAATLTFDNTGTALLAAKAITDTAASLAVAITGSGPGAESIALTGLTGTSLSITDSSTATGTAIVTLPTLDADLASVILTNTGATALTVGAIIGGSPLNSLITEGSTAITTSLTTTAASGSIEIGNGDSGSLTLTALNVGGAAGDTGLLALVTTTGNLTVSSGTVDVTGLALANTGSGLLSTTLTDQASGALTVTLTDAGAVKLTLTDTVAATTIVQTGTGNVTLTLNDSGISGDIISLADGNNAITINDSVAADTAGISVGGGINTIVLPTSHDGGNVILFSGVLGNNLNVSPVTADTIAHFQTDSNTAEGDVLSVGVTALITTADANTGGNTLWTVSTGGMMSKAGASVLNFIADVQTITRANGTAATSGIAGFSDGTNTWIAYNDHAGHVAVIELVGVVAVGIESGASYHTGYVHIM